MSFAETIILKSGQTIEGKLIEKTDEYIKVDFQGIVLTYFLDEINNIDGLSIAKNSIKFDKTKLVQKINQALVTITAEKDSEKYILGNGFMFNESGVGITAYHILLAATQSYKGFTIKVNFSDANSYAIEDIFKADSRKDICIFSINRNNTPYISFGDSGNIAIEERIYFISNPESLTATISEGNVINKRALQDTHYIQFSGQIQLGHCGGPIVNKKGEAIGVITLGQLNDDYHNYALAINEIVSFLNINEKMSLSGFPVDKRFYFATMGEALAGKGDYPKAIEYLKKAIEVAPIDAWTFYKLGTTYLRLNNSEIAKSYFNKALDLESNFPEALYNLGVIELNSGNPVKAKTYFEKTLSIDPYHKSAKEALSK
jgi:hypothetical protein